MLSGLSTFSNIDTSELNSLSNEVVNSLLDISNNTSPE